jgi:hypothetical protein
MFDGDNGVVSTSIYRSRIDKTRTNRRLWPAGAFAKNKFNDWKVLVPYGQLNCLQLARRVDGAPKDMILNP